MAETKERALTAVSGFADSSLCCSSSSLTSSWWGGRGRGLESVAAGERKRHARHRPSRYTAVAAHVTYLRPTGWALPSQRGEWGRWASAQR